MSADVSSACARRVASGSGHLCAGLAQELASCKLRFWTLTDCDGAVAAGDIHGGFWHAAVFAPALGGWKLVKLDSGDRY